MNFSQKRSTDKKRKTKGGETSILLCPVFVFTENRKRKIIER
jgi:hypothetical protein